MEPEAPVQPPCPGLLLVLGYFVGMSEAQQPRICCQCDLPLIELDAPMPKRAERSYSVSFRVPVSVKRAAEKAAQEDQRPLSSLILKALRAWLEANHYLEPPIRSE